MGYGGIKTIASVVTVMLLSPIAHLIPKILSGCLNFNSSNFLVRTGAVENSEIEGHIIEAWKD